MTIDDQMRYAHLWLALWGDAEDDPALDTYDNEEDLDDLEGDNWYGDSRPWTNYA